MYKPDFYSKADENFESFSTFEIFEYLEFQEAKQTQFFFRLTKTNRFLRENSKNKQTQHKLKTEKSKNSTKVPKFTTLLTKFVVSGND